MEDRYQTENDSSYGEPAPQDEVEEYIEVEVCEDCGQEECECEDEEEQEDEIADLADHNNTVVTAMVNLLIKKGLLTEQEIEQEMDRLDQEADDEDDDDSEVAQTNYSF